MGSPVGIPGRGRPIVWRILVGKGRRPFSQTSANPGPRPDLGFPRGGAGRRQERGPPPEGQALLTHGGAGRQLPRDRVSVSTGGGRGLRTRPPGRLPSPPRPACPLPAPFSRQVTRRLSCPRPELHPGTFTVDESPLRSTGSSQTRGRLGRPPRCAHRSCRQAARTGAEVAYPGRGARGRPPGEGAGP